MSLRSKITAIADAIRLKTGESGSYTLEQMATAIGAIQVSGSSGQAGNVPVLTQSQWDALSTAQKQAYGLVGVQGTTSGFERGKLVYGADYLDIGTYLPYSAYGHCICEATVDNYTNENALVWGEGTNQVQFTSAKSIKDIDNNAIRLDCATEDFKAYVDLEANSTPFTAYIVAKMIAPAYAYDRLISAINGRSSGSGIMLFNSDYGTISVSSWASDNSSNISSNDWFVGAIGFGGYHQAIGAACQINASSANDIYFRTKEPITAGRYLTIGRTDIDPDSNNAEDANILVRYLGVIDQYETENAIKNNMLSLASQFLS